MQKRNAQTGTPSIIRCECTSSEEVGSVVFVSGDLVGGKYSVRTADPQSDGNMPGVGVVIQKNGSDECFVQLDGIVYGVFSGLQPGKTYKVGLSGHLSRTPPAIGPGGYSMVQFIGVALASTVLRLNVQDTMTRRRG